MNSDSLNMVSRLGEGHMPCTFFLSEPQLKTTVRSSGILKVKQKLGVTFNSDKLGGIDFTKFSKLSMCSAGAGWCWLVLPPRHCTWSVLKFCKINAA